jgi:ribosomal protein L7/L12
MGLLVAVVLVMVAVGVSTHRRDAQRHQARLALVERKLDAVLGHLGVEVPEPHLRQVEALVRQGKDVVAIKTYREATGAGLLEAKQAVDRIGGRV